MNKYEDNELINKSRQALRQAFRDVCEDMLKEGKNEVEIRKLFTEFGEIFSDNVWRNFFFESGLWENLAIEGFYDIVVPKEKKDQDILDKKINGFFISSKDSSEDSKLKTEASKGFKEYLNSFLSVVSSCASCFGLSILEERKAGDKLFKAIEDNILNNKGRKLNANQKKMLNESLLSNGAIMTMLRRECIKRLIIKQKIITKIVKVFDKNKNENGFFNLINDEVDFALAEEGSIDSVVSEYKKKDRKNDDKKQSLPTPMNVEINDIKESQINFLVSSSGNNFTPMKQKPQFEKRIVTPER